MNCNVIKDLIPLYADNCCSEESAKLVEAHLKLCKECAEEYRLVKSFSVAESTVSMPANPNRINTWKASLLQSVLLFVFFGLITVGVALEAATPFGADNGFWALNLVVPATGFMLSLASWYFVRLYKNKNVFCACASLASLGVTLCAYVWATLHYQLTVSGMLGTAVYGLVFTALLFALSWLAASKYAAMLGKE